MADVKISGMTAATALTGAEVLPVVQSSANVKATTQQVVDAAMTTGLTRQALGSINTNTTIDWSAGSYVTATIGGALTFTFSNPAPTGKACVAYLQLTNGGSAAITWPVSVTWSGGTAPTLRASGVDLLRFYTQDNGTTWFGTAENDEPDTANSPGGSSGQLQYNDTNTFGGSPLWRDDANTVTQRNGTSAQTFRVYGTYTDASNYERLALNAAASGDWLQIAAETAGTGADNIGLAFTPAGTGAISAHVPDSGTAGGNARGANAVDLQTLRTGNTQVASGAQSSIGGGYANRASGQYARVGGGVSNTASQTATTVAGGTNVVASGYAATGCGGDSNTASGARSVVSGGWLNTASGDNSWIPGGFYGTTRGLSGAYAYSSGQRSAAGDAQVIGQPVRRTTTDATPVSLATDGTPAAATVMVLPANSTLLATAIVTCRDSSGNSAGWIAQALFKRDGSNNTTRLGTATVTAIGTPDAAVNTATIDLVANNTLEAAEIQVTGVAATTIYWCGELKCVQVA